MLPRTSANTEAGAPLIGVTRMDMSFCGGTAGLRPPAEGVERADCEVACVLNIRGGWKAVPVANNRGDANLVGGDVRGRPRVDTIIGLVAGNEDPGRVRGVLSVG